SMRVKVGVVILCFLVANSVFVAADSRQVRGRPDPSTVDGREQQCMSTAVKWFDKFQRDIFNSTLIPQCTHLTRFPYCITQTNSSARPAKTTEGLSTPSTPIPTLLSSPNKITTDVNGTEIPSHISESTQTIHTHSTALSTQASSSSVGVSDEEQTSAGYSSPTEKVTTEVSTSSISESLSTLLSSPNKITTDVNGTEIPSHISESTQTIHTHSTALSTQASSSSVGVSDEEQTSAGYSSPTEKVTTEVSPSSISESLSTLLSSPNKITTDVNGTEIPSHISESTQTIHTHSTALSTQASSSSVGVSDEEQTSAGYSSPTEKVTTEVSPSSISESLSTCTALPSNLYGHPECTTWHPTPLSRTPPERPLLNNRTSTESPEKKPKHAETSTSVSPKSPRVKTTASPSGVDRTKNRTGSTNILKSLSTPSGAVSTQPSIPYENTSRSTKSETPVDYDSTGTTATALPTTVVPMKSTTGSRHTTGSRNTPEGHRLLSQQFHLSLHSHTKIPTYQRKVRPQLTIRALEQRQQHFQQLLFQ
ncbi:hypothetical protein OSTOST_03142, partial [Ostertagia ostertagi]